MGGRVTWQGQREADRGMACAGRPSGNGTGAASVPTVAELPSATFPLALMAWNHLRQAKI